MVDLRRSARLLEALARGRPLAAAAEEADLDVDQAQAALRDLAERLARQSGKLHAEEKQEKKRVGEVKARVSDPDSLVFAFDGGSRGNPGPAAGVAIALDADGNPLVERSRFLDKTTNNVAEYQGLLLAIELAAELGVKRLRLQGDSELVVKQLQGEYRVKHKNIMPLFIEAMRRLRRFAAWEVRYVPREENEAADKFVQSTLNRYAPKAKKKTKIQVDSTADN